MVIKVVTIHCTLLLLYSDQSAVYVSIVYALFKKDSCVIFQSFGDDAQLCSYNLNYAKPETLSIENRRYSTKMKIQYYTYLRRNTRRKLNCKNKNAGVQIRTTAPEILFLQLYDNDIYMEHDVT